MGEQAARQHYSKAFLRAAATTVGVLCIAGEGESELPVWPTNAKVVIINPKSRSDVGDLRHIWYRYGEVAESLPYPLAPLLSLQDLFTDLDPGTAKPMSSWDLQSPTHKAPEVVMREIEALFAAARDEDFEDGMESRFSKGLVSMIRTHGNAATEAITSIIVQENANSEVVYEAMRWLGHIDDPPTYEERLCLLQRGLYYSLVRVRDGAALGLASLDDPHAIPSLKQAIEREQCGELRADMMQVLAQLERDN